jgi:hypothetical protein
MMKQLFAFLLLFVFVPRVLADSYKVETIGALTETKVAESMRAAVSDKGLRVADAKGKVVCEVWFNKSLPTVKEVPSSALFGIPEGAFAGIIHFPNNASDFRGQGIKPGYYTLRYALILQDGNHLGVSPSRDFFLIASVADDKDPKASLKNDEMLKLSRAGSGSSHPSPWSLVSPTSEKDLPRVVTNEHEHVILETKIPTASGALAVGLIVVGRTEG